MSSATRNRSELVPNWTPRQRPARAPLIGHWCTLEPLDPDLHAAQLHLYSSERYSAGLASVSTRNSP